MRKEPIYKRALHSRLSDLLVLLIFNVIPAVSTLLLAQDSVTTKVDTVVLRNLWEESANHPSDTLRGHHFREALIAYLKKAEDPFKAPIPKLYGLADLPLNAKQKLRIITWSHPTIDRENRYMGLAVAQDKNANYHLHHLKDRYLPVGQGFIQESWFNETYRPNKWIGTVYYAGREFRHKQSQHFILCGIAGGTPMVVRRIVEIIHLHEDGQIAFGEPLILYGKKNYRRIMFSHNARIAMTLHPMPTEPFQPERILIDHLSPSQSQFGGLPQFYGPDGSQDILILQKNGTWLFKPDIPVNAL